MLKKLGIADFATDAWITLCLLILSRTFMPTIIGSEKLYNIDVEEGSRSFQIVTGFVYLGCACLCFIRPEQLWRLLSTNILLTLFIAYAFASILWSQAFDISLRKGLGFLGTSVIGLYLALHCTPQRFVRLLSVSLLISLCASLWYLATDPYSIHRGTHEGAWRSGFGHKNDMGKVMSLGFLAFLYLSLIYSKWWLLITAAFAITLYYTQSRVGWVSAALVPVLLCLISAGSRAPKASLLTGAILLVLTALFTTDHSLDIQEVLQPLGRDSSLSGRTGIWGSALSEGINNFPMIGAGYRAFWAADNPWTQSIWSTIGWQPIHGHNSYFDVFLELGVVGFFLLGAILYLFIKRTSRIRDKQDQLVIRGLTAFVLVVSLTEDALMSPNTLYWAILCMCIFRTNMTDSVPQSEPEAPLRAPSGEGHQ